MALSRIWSAFIIIAILVASAKMFFTAENKTIFSSMVTGKTGDTILVSRTAVNKAIPGVISIIDSNDS